uniref:Uncharacterized protein n=1 Tax=Tanacetum cinerariifolium TaxID=118510 RepID=A0A6L2JM37_TANCI|nr:hypothetical protein [Tanacetum cinerariifolium]
MAKKDMDMYHSRLTQVNLDELIIKYNIPRDLHPRPPSKEFVMSELSDDAIGVYHRVFDFSVGSFGAQQGCYRRGALLRRAPSLVCIDDNRSCIKSWKSGFFLIDRRVILDYMSLRHPSSVIGDPKPPVGSYSQKDVRRLSAHVVNLRDISDGVLVMSGLIMSILDFLCLPESTGAEVYEEPYHDISAKVLTEDETFKKRKASLSDAPSGHVAKRTWSAMAQSSGSTTWPNIFADNSKESDVDEDACVEIPLITHLRSAVVIPTEGNQSGGSVPPAAEGPSIQDSQGKAIMTDAAGASSVGGSRPRPSSGLAPSVQDFYEYVIHRYLFSFSPGPYYALYLEDGVAGSCEFSREEWHAPHQPTLSVLTKKVYGLKKQVTDLNDKLSSSDIAFVKAKAKAKGSFQSLVRKFLASDEFRRVQGELLFWLPGFERGGVPAPKDTRVSPPMANESTVTPVSLSLELPSNDALFSYVAALGQNEEWVNAMVDIPNDRMTDRAVNESTEIFVHGVAHPVNENVAGHLWLVCRNLLPPAPMMF